jgi:hypothetical protein
VDANAPTQLSKTKQLSETVTVKDMKPKNIHLAVKAFCQKCPANLGRGCESTHCSLFPFQNGGGCQCEQKFIRYDPIKETPDFNRIKNNG